MNYRLSMKTALITLIPYIASIYCKVSDFVERYIVHT